jgi:hypothetical protein
MSAAPVPPPESEKRAARREGLRTIARLLEEQMDEMELSEEEKNLRVESFVEDVKKVKTPRAESHSK